MTPKVVRQETGESKSLIVLREVEADSAAGKNMFKRAKLSTECHTPHHDRLVAVQSGQPSNPCLISHLQNTASSQQNQRFGSVERDGDQVKQRLNFENSSSLNNSKPPAPMLDYSPYLNQKRNMSPETRRIILEQQKVIETLHSQLQDLQKKVTMI